MEEGVGDYVSCTLAVMHLRFENENLGCAMNHKVDIVTRSRDDCLSQNPHFLFSVVDYLTMFVYAPCNHQELSLTNNNLKAKMGGHIPVLPPQFGQLILQ